MAGCGASHPPWRPPSRSSAERRPRGVATHEGDWVREATRVGRAETRARVIAAADAVVKHADEGHHRRVQPSWLHGPTAILHLCADRDGERDGDLDLSSAENANGSQRDRAHRPARHGAGREPFRALPREPGLSRQSAVFYARIEYLLGRRPGLGHLLEAPGKLALRPGIPGFSRSAALTHQGRDAPPPPRTPKAAPPPPRRQGALPRRQSCPPDEPGLRTGRSGAVNRSLGLPKYCWSVRISLPGLVST